MRITAILEYDGSEFSGWQTQAAGRTVQACVEAALSAVADHAVSVTVAGRTDAGVHACAQVIHFDTDAPRAPRAWVFGANSHLPRDVALLWAGEVGGDFHARFSASGRRYRYVILNRPVRAALSRTRATWDYRPLDVDRMRAGAGRLVGTHDFSAFRAAECQAKSPVRALRALDVRRDGAFVVIDAYANAFLQHMVRNIVGVLTVIGAGEREPAWAREVLLSRDRTAGGVTAPAAGLYLVGIEYPPPWSFPALAPSLVL